MTERCDNCRFGRPTEFPMPAFGGDIFLPAGSEILCRRFPKAEFKDLDGWCGEWKKVSKDA